MIEPIIWLEVHFGFSVLLILDIILSSWELERDFIVIYPSTFLKNGMDLMRSLKLALEE